MTATAKTIGSAIANLAAFRRSLSTEATQESRRARYDELIARQHALGERFAARASDGPDQDALNRDIWAIRKGLSPIGWCAHCAEPIYDHEPSHSAAGDIYCDRHARAHWLLAN